MLWNKQHQWNIIQGKISRYSDITKNKIST